jgi:hypothetical protein
MQELSSCDHGAPRANGNDLQLPAGRRRLLEIRSQLRPGIRDTELSCIDQCDLFQRFPSLLPSRRTNDAKFNPALFVPLAAADGLALIQRCQPLR